MPTSKLQEQVAEFIYRTCRHYTIYENYRPEWLISDRGTRLELDFYVPEILLAVEVQGAQHYVYIEHFHKNPEGFQRRLTDDEYKRDYCEKHKIRLVEIASEQEIQNLVGIIFPSLTPRGPKYQVPIHKQHKHFDKAIKEFQNIKPKRDTTLENSSKKQIKFDALVDRLHGWMDGEMTLSNEPHPKFFKQGLHKFLEGYQRFSREQDRNLQFLKFLESKFPEYKTDICLAREFFKEQNRLFPN